MNDPEYTKVVAKMKAYWEDYKVKRIK